jgi:hypothetical protein
MKDGIIFSKTNKKRHNLMYQNTHKKAVVNLNALKPFK